MAEEVPAKETRKTVTMSHKQLGVGGTILATIIGLSQFNEIKQIFWTREEGQAAVTSLTEVKETLTAKVDELKVSQEKGITEVKELMIAQDKENLDRLRRSNDLIREYIKEVDQRAEHSIDNTVRRIENLEMYAYKQKGR